MPSVKELREIRAPLAKQIETLAKEMEGHAVTPEEQEKWDKVNTDYDSFSEQIDLASRGEGRAARAEQVLADQEAAAGGAPIGREDTDGQGNTPPPQGQLSDDLIKELLNRMWGTDGASQANYPGGPSRDLVWARYRNSAEYREAFGDRMKPEYQAAFNRFLRSGFRGLSGNEKRALQVDLDESGGYLAAGEQFVARLIKDIDNLVFIRQMATIFPVADAESLGAPSLDTDVADPTWTGEITAAGEDSSMAFGKRNLHPHPLSKLIKVSRTLLRKSVLPAEQIVRERLAYVFGTVEENAYLNGSGSNQPLGVFTASDDGVSTSRDVSTDNEGTNVTADGLINCLYSLKAQYLTNSTWVFHRTLIRNIRKLKDGEGNYLWMSGLVSDRPDTILQRPYVMSEYAPSTLTVNSYVGILGDFSYYWIADALNMEIQRLDELYSTTNQVGFIGRREADGMPVLANAFARVKLAAS